MNFDALFTNPIGRTARADYLAGMATVLVAIAFFAYLVTGRTAHFCMLMLMYPTFVLLARRLQDMGRPGALVLVPLVLALASFGVKLGYFSLGAAIDGVVMWIALAVSAVYVAWGSTK